MQSTSHLSEWLSSINQQTTSVGEDVEKGGPFCTVGGNADWCSHCGKQYGDTRKNEKIGSAFWPSDPTSGNISEGTQNTDPKNINSPMFIAVLFIINKIWKQPKCQSIDEWIKPLWGIHTMEFYLDIKRKSYPLWQHGGSGEHYNKWNKPVRERQIPCDFTHMWNLMNKLN